MSALSVFVAKRLVVVDGADVGPPGAGKAHVWGQADGSSVSIISRGDALDIYLGKKTMYNLTLEPRVAVAMAKWLLRWWVFTQWCGIKLILWHWTIRKSLEEQKSHG